VRTLRIDRAAKIGNSLGQAALPSIRAAFAAAGCTCIAGASVAAVDAAGVTLADGRCGPARTIVRVTGMLANPLAALLGLPLDTLVPSGAAAKATKRVINWCRRYPPRDRDPAANRAAAAPILHASPATGRRG